MNHSIKFLVIFLFISGLFSGLSQAQAIDVLVPEQEKALALEYLKSVHQGDYQKVVELSHTGLIELLNEEKFQQLVDVFAEGDIDTTEITGFKQSISGDETHTKLMLLASIGEHQYLNEVKLLKDKSDTLSVIGFFVRPDVQELKQKHAFSNVPLSPGRIMMLALTTIVPVFMLVTFIAVILTPFTKKVRWGLVSFVGIGQLTMNWTTGALDYALIRIQLFGFGVAAPSQYDPYLLTVSLPLGALAFWLKRKQLIEEAKPELSSESTSG